MGKPSIAASKVRGVQLGKPRLNKARTKAPAVKQVNADAFAKSVAPFIREAWAAGATTFRAVAASLNERGVPTATGRRKWEAATVFFVAKRLSACPDGRGGKS
jgi:hypothetical protein